MEQPPEWVDARYPAADYICQLQRSMYGLPQASHCAQEKLRATLTADGNFTQTTADDCIYVSTDPVLTSHDFVATGTHVDDLLTIGAPSGIKNLVSTLEKDFELVVKKDPTVITGVQIERDRKHKWLKLHQAAYIDGILAEFNMTDCTPLDHTPLGGGLQANFMALPVATAETADPVVQALYRKLIGLFIWLYRTRPDFMFVCNLFARNLHNSTRAHLILATGRPLRYLKGTRTRGLVFAPGLKEFWGLSGSSDSDLAGDIRTSRSTIGHCLTFGQYGTISFHCTLERKVATSTQQAETYAAVGLVKDTVWMRSLLHELGFKFSGPIAQRVDNRGVFLQSTKQVNHATAKHFRIGQAFIRSMVEAGIVSFVNVGTKSNETDIFTKGTMSREDFINCRHRIMGPQDRPSESE
jgi:hypothetical protein